MKTIDINSFIEDTRMGKPHFMMLFWSCLIIMFDMYDLVIYGSVLPKMMQEWGMTPVQAGSIGSMGPFGMMLGAIVFGILADKFGRRRILITSVVLFSLATTLCALAPGAAIFGALRFIAGLGIGGILPTVIAMLTDFAPRGRANTMVAIIMCFFSIGGILAAGVAMILIPAFGWQATFWVAAIPLVLLPLMVKHFYDSPQTLLKNGQTAKLRHILLAVNPTAQIPDNVTFTGLKEREQGSPIGALFRNRRALATLMIWIAFFSCLLMVNGINTWLPNLMVTAGFALGSSLTFMVVLNIGAIVGTMVMGQVSDKVGVKVVLVPMFFISAISLTLLGFGGSMAILLALVFVAGACTMGAQNISYSFVSQYYPSFMRSTAIGMASGVGRIGAIVGPSFGGVLLTYDLPVPAYFIAFAVPGVIAAIAFFFVPLSRKKKQETQVPVAKTGEAPVLAT
ncbi:4-hydroxybenzoate transporter PcaK [Corynebacterium faecale]|uniref:MFS transporter n=1 Tax=Corynebacterium faecale TaxID=1758466 RepID=UPI0025B4F48D|nr:aromatic acid/H+ symport family MFS transporter [Corynebacterium faecale]WJY91811.1 4-hydroxybenzoate transporter PcaK [Corynebacterium faecale]